MKFLLSIVILSIIAIIGSRITFYKRRLPMGFRHILFVGTEYLFLGVLFGRMGLNFIDEQALSQLEPALHFGLGWIGVLFGLQFEIKQLKNLPRHYFSITAIQALCTFVIVFFPLYYLLLFMLKNQVTEALVSALALASAACCTAQSALAIVSGTHKFINRGLADLLRYISGVDGLFGLCFFSIALCILQGIQESGFSWTSSLGWLAISFAMGIVPALIFITLSNRKISVEELLLYIIGTVLFCTGLAQTLHHSPLVSGLICGVVIANLSHHRMRVLSTVIHAEKSMYIMLLLILGASWSIPPQYNLLFIIAYFSLRVVGKVIGSFTAIQLFPPRYDVPLYLGLGLVPEGGLAIAIIINCTLLPIVHNADIMITIIVFSVLLSELIGPFLIVKLFRDRK